MSGSYLRHSIPEPQHACVLPSANALEGAPEPRDVWRCAVCERVYIWNDSGGYGFKWRRVRLRKWWYEFRYGWRH